MHPRRLLISLALSLAAPLSALAQPADNIVVAQIGPFTVLPAPDAQELNEGIRAALDEVNGKGGINGRQVDLLTLDDAYSYSGFKTRLKEALGRKAVALLSPIGSPTLKSVLDDKLLDSNDIVILNTLPGASVLREPGHPRLFHVRAGDEQQIRKIVEHARALTIKSMGVLYQDIPVGSSGFTSAQVAAADGGGMKVDGVQSGTDPASIAAAAKAIADARPQSVLAIGSPRFMGESVKALRAAGVSQQIFTLSYLPAPAMHKIAGPGARGVGIAQAFPNPTGVVKPLQRRFQAAMKASHPELKGYTPVHMEGYVTARVFIEAALNARTVSPSGLAESLRRMGEVDMGGFRVKFGPDNVGSSWVDIGVVTADGRLLY
ncbi:MAG: ABC transporter substrate-binding protein [Burkholderiaceae bacterium]